MKRRPGIRMIFVAAAVSMPSTWACSLVGGGTEITAETKCSEYLKADRQKRHDAAVRITAELRTSEPGNPMWGLTLDSSCGRNPTNTVRQALGK